MWLGSSLGFLCEQIRINLKFVLGKFSVCSEGNINQYSNLLFRVLAAKYRLRSNRACVLKN